ncbi:aldo/keto reductase [Aquibium sp. A9E412]|uniref:aldo/keto reductase n=1 Tax=Aquibium sp. A9E412 TaxID=2976767 RepID=UPI0025AFFA41|nr:aldo/keto reductase [Aquibium sp. A9E412]MDN2565528.1 aldo/keto reductase [Aquibium sp. A9E412]
MSDLHKTPLYRDGPRVARLCLGTMMFGDQTDEAEAGRIVEAYLAAGGDFFDTADVYAGGASETILGRLLKPVRQDVFVATKVGNPVAGVAGSGGLSPEWIERAASMSLDRLATDSIDLYYLHVDDNHTPLDEVIGALGGLLSAGAIRHWGFSNFRPWKIAEMVRVADRLGVARPVVAQPYYHMLNRVAEADTIPACRHFGIGVVPYSPLGRGVLTGKYRGGTPEGSRAARGDARLMETEFLPETLARAAEAADHAERRGRTPSGLAIRWVLANQQVSSVLIGPKSTAQLDGYLAAAREAYDGEDETFLSGLCAPGATPVPAHFDPRYPFDGRHVRLAEEAGQAG